MVRTLSQPAAADTLLSDGSAVTIRPLEADDHAAVLDLHANRMSPGNHLRRLRRLPDAHEE